MAAKNYDIFISYRRKDTSDKAEHLKDLLEKAGFEKRNNKNKNYNIEY